MVFTKKIDRAFQWAGEKLGSEARTTYSEEFKALESEMTLRHEGMEKLQKSMNVYVKWMARKCDTFEDKDRNTPSCTLGRALSGHGEDFEADSDFGNCLVALGRANERVANIQETYVENASATWLDHVERNLAMLKEYTAARKKLENRRLAFDSSSIKMEKARRDDFRIEEEVRMNRAKFEESEEDVARRMQDIKETETESVEALTSFLDSQLEYHERAAEELRRVRSQWAGSAAGQHQQVAPSPRPIKSRSRSNTARSWQEPRQAAVHEEPEPADHQEQVPRLPTRPSHNRAAPPPPPASTRPAIQRSTTHDGRLAPTAFTQAAPPVPNLPLTRIHTYGGSSPHAHHGRDEYGGDDHSSYSRSGSGSPEFTERSASPATSYGSLSRSTSAQALKKAAPPPPVNRAKKPPPPPPSRKPSQA